MCVRFDFPYSSELAKKTYGLPNVLFVEHLLFTATELSSKLLVQLSANVFTFASTRACLSCWLCHCAVASAMPISWHRAGSDADSGKDFIWLFLVWCAFFGGGLCLLLDILCCLSTYVCRRGHQMLWRWWPTSSWRRWSWRPTCTRAVSSSASTSTRALGNCQNSKLNHHLQGLSLHCLVKPG